MLLHAGPCDADSFMFSRSISFFFRVILFFFLSSFERFDDSFALEECDYDTQRGVPGPGCIARAMYAQPDVTATAELRTIENDVEVLVPRDEYAKRSVAD